MRAAGLHLTLRDEQLTHQCVAAVETRQLQIADLYLLQLQGRYQPLLRTSAGFLSGGGFCFQDTLDK
jgi:hypothetical protein